MLPAISLDGLIVLDAIDKKGVFQQRQNRYFEYLLP